MSRQRTIEKPVEVSGRGLFSGEPARLRMVPAPPDSGLAFVRTDLPAPVRIAVSIANVAKRARRTTLANGTAAVETVEHVLAAVAGMGIDNLTMELSGSEVPSADGSPLMFADALRQAAIREQEAQRHCLVIDQPVTVTSGAGSLTALPGPDDCLDVIYDLDYPDDPQIGRQVAFFCVGRDDFAGELAGARTFATQAEAAEMQSRGIGTHLSARDVLVIGPDGPVDNALRFPNEPARHKLLDVLGDLALLGRPVRGRIIARRSGHEHNHALVRRLARLAAARRQEKALAGEPAMDIRRVMRLLPHRYPFLMVDRVIELDGEKRVVGIKNVTINEPFFQGHYPGQPIMPGVMILEALAQISGILLGRRLEHTGKVAVLLSMDRVKMRRPVRPGDQMLLEAEALHVRSRTGHCSCRATVGGELAAEAEIKFMLVDAEPV